jgi:tetratricopeptide (TPR) repeat protein
MEAAVDAFDSAVRLAKDPELLLAARVARGRARRAAGQPAGAIEDLVEAVAQHIARGEDVAAAFLRYDLSAAYQDTGQLLDAAEAGEAALDVLDRTGELDAADRTRYLLSRVYRDLGEADQALVLLDRLAESLDGYDNLPARGQMLEEAAHILYAEDRDGQAASRFGAAAAAYRAASLPLDQLRATRWRAVALRWADEPEAAFAALGEADTLASSLPADEPATVWERAMLGYDAARVHIGADQGEEALARLAGCAAAFRGIEAYGEALHVDLLEGELLLRLDRPAEAEPVLRHVLGGAPHDSQLRENAAWLLCDALDALGRTDEAAALRRELGL